MQKLIFDQFELDTFSFEEWLEIHVASKKPAPFPQFADLQSIVAVSAGSDAVARLGAPGRSDALVDDRGSFSSMPAHLKRFAGIIVPDPCHWPMFVLFEGELEWDGVFETPDMFIRSHWLSTA